MTRAQTHHAYARNSNRRRRYQDFFCLDPIGIRVAYASPKLLRTLARRARTRYAGRVIWASTSNPYYALAGIRPGAALPAARRHLAIRRPLRIGANAWYLARYGSATAVLKVRRGVVQEVGVAVRALTRRRRAQWMFLASL